MALELEAGTNFLEPHVMRMRLFDGEQLLAERLINFSVTADYLAWCQAAAAMRQHERLVTRARLQLTEDGRTLRPEPNPLADQALTDAIGVLFPMFGQPVDGVAIDA